MASPQSYNAASKVGFEGTFPADNASESLKSPNIGAKKQSALEKYNIDEKDTPWFNLKD